MKRDTIHGLATALIVLSGCDDGRRLVDPADDRPKWNWDSPLATVGSGPTLICSPLTVSFNGTVSCTLANAGPLNFPTWRFEAAGGLTRAGPLGSGGWSGPLVISGDVVVSYSDDQGGLAQDRETVIVTRRNWSWSSLVGGMQGALGAIDTCFQTGWEGLTASRDCTLTTAGDFFTPRLVSNGSGYTAAQVPGSGPNGGWWYVTSPTAVMDLRTQVRKDYRTDGITFPVAAPAAVANGCATAYPQAPTAPRNMHAVNTSCVPTTAFTNLVNCIWTHEAVHLNAGVTAAQMSAYDVHRLWEPLVATSAANLQNDIAFTYDIAEDSVSRRLIDAHNSLQVQTFGIWYNTGSGWGSGTTNRAVTC